MPGKPLGYAWLKDHFKLQEYHLTHTSLAGTRLRKEIDENGDVTETYPPHYIPGDNSLDHLEFALKYDDLSLDFLKAVFNQISLEEITDSINKKPKAAYQRRVGFLYEFLTGIEIPVPNQSKTNYINLLDDEKYVTGKIIKNQRWLINDNLPGTREFCPVIRKTTALQSIYKEDFKKLVEKVTLSFPPDIFHRPLNYLYTKETRSSYQIEKEKPTPERVGRFVRLLEKAGEQPLKELLSEVQLTALQNEIVDSRYAAAGFRQFQNYIGQTTFNYKQIVHYVCPPPQFVNSLMNGLLTAVEKMEESPALIRATVAAFAFVFVHPFEDGNGRLHRFLIHDMLTRGGVVRKGMIIPVSAHMVNHIKEYDMALENYSKPLLAKVRYEMDNEQKMTVSNPGEVEGYFRYPDLTVQSVYLGKTVKETIEEDIYMEMEFLVNYDEVKAAIGNIVDMPDKKIDLLIKFIHQNKGTFPNRRRNQFEELSDEEILKMQNAFREIFNIPL